MNFICKDLKKIHSYHEKPVVLHLCWNGGDLECLKESDFRVDLPNNVLDFLWEITLFKSYLVTLEILLASCDSRVLKMCVIVTIRRTSVYRLDCRHPSDSFSEALSTSRHGRERTHMGSVESIKIQNVTWKIKVSLTTF